MDSRTPQGVRGLKQHHLWKSPAQSCRTPQGVRGLKHDANYIEVNAEASHSARSAWIETITTWMRTQEDKCRTPQGVRGLKQGGSLRQRRSGGSHSARSAWIETFSYCRGLRPFLSHSARSAWIETVSSYLPSTKLICRTPQGVRGLKLDTGETCGGFDCRTPQGVRGLKPARSNCTGSSNGSHSARSAWIETVS